MKNFSPLFLLFLSAPVFGQVDYTPFEFTGSIWRESYYDGSSGGGSQGIYTEEYQYTVTGDTIINAIQYFKLNIAGVAQYGSGPMSPKSYFSYYTGAIRETAGKEVKIVFSGQTDETFLYSFDLHLGDTIQIYGQSGNIVTVGQVDTVEICGKSRNRYLLNFSNGVLTPVYLIEGVGNTHGLIPEFEFFESGTSLGCYSNGNCTPCETIVGQNEPAARKKRAEIFPNPVENFMTIRLAEPEGATIYVFGNQGKQISRISMAGETEVLDISQWISGVYFIKICRKDSMQVERIVKN